MKTRAYWHIHHDVLVEYTTAPIEERIWYIQEHKPPEEVAVRLRLLKPVVGELPKAFAAAAKALVAARKALDAAEKAYRAAVKANPYAAEKALTDAPKSYADAVKANRAAVKAFAAAEKALAATRLACADEIEKLHRNECPDCPWDGKTIFPKVKQ